MEKDVPIAETYFYLEGTDYSGLIGTYAALKAIDLNGGEDAGQYFEGGGIERNHLIPQAFFNKGPASMRYLADWVPTLPLQRREHRGSAAAGSFHNLKRYGINDFLAAKGLSIKKASYTSTEVDVAIEACREWHAKIGMKHAAMAIEEFEQRFYNSAKSTE